MPQNCPHAAGPPLNCEGNSACTFLLADRERRARLPELAEHVFCPPTLRRHSWLEPGLLRTRWGFGLWNAWGWVPAASQASRKPWGGWRVDSNGSSVSSGPIGASALGLCGIQFTLTGADLFRNFWELELLKEVRKSGRKSGKRRRFLCMADCWGCLFSEDSGEEGLDVESWLFVPGVDRAQCSLVCGVQFSQHRLLRGLFFPHCLFLAPFYEVTDIKPLGLFWGSLFCSLGPCVHFCANSTFSWWISYVISGEVWEGDASSLLSFLDAFGYSESFVFPHKCSECLFYFCGKCHWSFDQACFVLEYFFGFLTCLLRNLYAGKEATDYFLLYALCSVI